MYFGMRSSWLRALVIALELGILMFVVGSISNSWPWALPCAALILVGNVGTIVLIGRKDSAAPLTAANEA